MADERWDFEAVARTWDDDPGRVDRTRQLAAAIAGSVPLQGNWSAMDYGCGTGLLTVLLSARLGHVVAVDNSQEMLEVLAGKLRDLGIGNIEVRCLDLTTEATPDERFDLIFSSMALHHMSEPAALVGTLAGLMRPGGYLAIADLDAEDGSFHGEAAGEVHHGFSEAQMRGFMGGAGLTDPEVGVAHVMTREEADGGVREYRVLLTVAQKG